MRPRISKRGFVRPSVGLSVRYGDWVGKSENAHFRPCPSVRDWYWPCIRPCFEKLSLGRGFFIQPNFTAKKKKVPLNESIIRCVIDRVKWWLNWLHIPSYGFYAYCPQWAHVTMFVQFLLVCLDLMKFMPFLWFSGMCVHFDIESYVRVKYCCALALKHCCSAQSFATFGLSWSSLTYKRIAFQLAWILRFQTDKSAFH